MFIGYFTEQPYSVFHNEWARQMHDYDHPARRATDNTLLLSNRNFDPVAGSRLYQERLAEYVLAEEVGFDGIMLNEHHNGAFCMQPRCNIMSAMVAARTSRIRIVQLGNPLPVWDNPVQCAEETAMIDMVSNGRLIAGVVRGGGVEQLANNANPAFNRERFAEAHDLLIKAWTVPGPYRWEGDHYNLRVVNPWALPLQKPHPPVWIPGVVSKETVEFAARHGYPYICLNTTVDQTNQTWKFFDSKAAEVGYAGGPSYRGYLVRIMVSASEEKAIRNAHEFLWMRGEFTGVGHPVWAQPTGYVSREARRARKTYTSHSNDFQAQLDAGTIIAGTPKQAIERLRMWLEKTGPSILMLWAHDGKVGHEDTKECITLLGQEVLPAVREIGDKLGLRSPLETGQPVSVAAARAVAAAA